MIEVELKAKIESIETMAETIASTWISCSPYENLIYRDHYFDDGSQTLSTSERELRIREINRPDNDTCQIQLTFKDSPLDEQSKSKEETELRISDVQEGVKLLKKLGYRQVLCFEKECVRCQYWYGEFLLSVTLAYVPELDTSFIEIETQTDSPGDVEKLKKMLAGRLHHLGIKSDQITNEYYTDAIKTHRNTRQ